MGCRRVCIFYACVCPGCVYVCSGTDVYVSTGCAYVHMCAQAYINAQARMCVCVCPVCTYVCEAWYACAAGGAQVRVAGIWSHIPQYSPPWGCDGSTQPHTDAVHLTSEGHARAQACEGLALNAGRGALCVVPVGLCCALCVCVCCSCMCTRGVWFVCYIIVWTSDLFSFCGGRALLAGSVHSIQPMLNVPPYLGTCTCVRVPVCMWYVCLCVCAYV